MIAPSVMVHVILTSEFIIGCRMLNSEIQKVQAEVNQLKIENAPMDAMFCIHNYIIAKSLFFYIVIKDYQRFL